MTFFKIFVNNAKNKEAFVLQITPTFPENVHRAWGNPKAVAEAALNELFRHGDDIGLDYDDQIRYAVKVGILTGETKNENADVFIQRFENEILNEE